MFKFNNWLRLNEMPHFAVKGDMIVPCSALIDAGIELPCIPGKKIKMIDMRFELYPKKDFDWTKLMGFGAKFVAFIPETTECLVRDEEVNLVNIYQAREKGILPKKDITGLISPMGYVLLPRNWLKYAVLLDEDYNVIKQ